MRRIRRLLLEFACRRRPKTDQRTAAIPVENLPRCLAHLASKSACRALVNIPPAAVVSIQLAPTATEPNDVFDLPKGELSLFIGMLRQNEGKLSKRRKNSKFADLNDEEIRKFEEIFAETFDAAFRNEKRKRDRPGRS